MREVGTKRRWWWGAAVGLAALVVALAAGDRLLGRASSQTAPERPEVGYLAPDFTLPAVDGTRVTLSALRGKKAVFVNFWASWCLSCQAEMPTMEALYRRFRDAGLEILAVSIDAEPSDAASFAKARGLTFPILLDPDSRVANAYRVTGIPTHYFIDRRGVVRSREVGPHDWSRPETWTAVEEVLR